MPSNLERERELQAASAFHPKRKAARLPREGRSASEVSPPFACLGTNAAPGAILAPEGAVSTKYCESGEFCTTKHHASPSTKHHA